MTKDTATAASIPVRAGAAQPMPSATPWHGFDTLRGEIDRVFEDFGRGWWSGPFGRSLFDAPAAWTRSLVRAAMPSVDIAEKDDAYQVSAELPGMDEKSIAVEVARGVLTISGEKQEAKNEEKQDYHLSERRYGAFRRSFRVPEDVDAGRIEARFAQGVLTVTLPKAPAAEAGRKIDVKAA